MQVTALQGQKATDIVLKKNCTSCSVQVFTDYRQDVKGHSGGLAKTHNQGRHGLFPSVTWVKKCIFKLFLCSSRITYLVPT